VERIKEMRNQIPGHRLRYYADAVDAGLSIEDVKAGRVETWMGVAKADLLRERDEARAERDDLTEALRTMVTVFIPSGGLTVASNTEWAVHTIACDLLATLDEGSN